MPPLIDPGVIVLSSPMLGDTISVRRRTSFVDSTGIGRNSDETFRVGAIVEPDGDNDSSRDDEGAIGRKTISVITRFRLQGQVAGLLQDIVTWHNDDFLVITVEDATSYGAGWIEAICTSQDTQDAPTGT
jgi:hypothetical protein